MSDMRWDETSPPTGVMPAAGPGTPAGSNMGTIPAGAGASGGTEQSKPAQVADQATSEAANVKDHAVEAVSEVKEQAGAEIESLKHDVKEQTRDLLEEARERVGTQVDSSARQLADALGEAGDELTTMASCAKNPDGPAAEVVRQLGDRVAQTAQRLQTQGYRGIADDLTRWARQRPGTFLLAAGAAGFLAGRVLRNVDTQSIAEAAKGDSTVSSNGTASFVSTGSPGGMSTGSASSPASSGQLTPAPVYAEPTVPMSMPGSSPSTGGYAPPSAPSTPPAPGHIGGTGAGSGMVP